MERQMAPSTSPSHNIPSLRAFAPPPYLRWSGKWVVSMDQYTQDSVGAKSRNLAALRGRLPDWISLPASVTVRLRAAGAMAACLGAL